MISEETAFNQIRNFLRIKKRWIKSNILRWDYNVYLDGKVKNF